MNTIEKVALFSLITNRYACTMEHGRSVKYVRFFLLDLRAIYNKLAL